MTELTISHCYHNVQYDTIDEKEIESKISHLFAELRFYKNHTFSKRFFDTASIIKSNISLFQSICKHVDESTTIIDCLNHFGIKFMFDSQLEEEEDQILSILFTLFNISTNYLVQESVIEAILKNSKLESYICDLCNQWSCRSFEIILLEDSDMYAVLKELKVFSNIHKIWVQEAIAEKFIMITQNMCNNLYNYIHIFRSKQELISSCSSTKMCTVSIWSEDIVAAKNLATLLNGDIFINTCMDFRDGIVLLPYTSKSCEDLKLPSNESNNLNKLSVNKMNLSEHEYFTYNFFYDGMWQKPVEDTYMICNEYMLADATKGDVDKCIDSAKKGVKIWSTKSINYRIQILSKLATILECNGKCQLASIISKWIKFPSLAEKSLIYPQSGNLEVTTIRKPRGVIVFKAESLTTLFWRLTLALITGNSVIVLCNSISCTLVPYCDMFSTSGIPPGVVNMLSVDDVEGIIQDCYAKEDKTYPENNPMTTYLNLTTTKQIVLPLK